MSEYKIEELTKQLRLLGLSEGDRVLIRASLKKIGEIEGNGNTPNKVIEAFLSAVGESGTIIALSFTKTFIFPKRHTDYVYSSSTPAITGGLANAMIKWPGAVRSKHPSNSFVAIGRDAKYILSEHDENATCFSPIAKLLELNGKMVLVGCVKDSPGYSTVHFAQNRLNLSTKTILKNVYGVYYRKENGAMALFKKTDIPGCSEGFSKFYSHYVKEGYLKTGFVGDAYSALINVTDAYNIEYDLLKKNPKIALCDNQNCIFCRAGVYYNKIDWTGFYLRMFPILLKKVYSLITEK
jgi:aminoglycoside N3'-acetyltransferase